jgi:hypothetical protein
MTDNVTASAFNVNNDVTSGFSTGDIWRAASDKVLSTEEVKRAIEGPGKDFGKSTSG